MVWVGRDLKVILFPPLPWAGSSPTTPACLVWWFIWCVSPSSESGILRLCLPAWISPLKPGAEFVAGENEKWLRWFWKGQILSCWGQSCGVASLKCIFEKWHFYLFSEFTWWSTDLFEEELWDSGAVTLVDLPSQPFLQCNISAEKQHKLYQLPCCGCTSIWKKMLKDWSLICSILCYCLILYRPFLSIPPIHN